MATNPTEIKITYEFRQVSRKEHRLEVGDQVIGFFRQDKAIQVAVQLKKALENNGVEAEIVENE